MFYPIKERNKTMLIICLPVSFLSLSKPTCYLLKKALTDNNYCRSNVCDSTMPNKLTKYICYNIEHGLVVRAFDPYFCECSGWWLETNFQNIIRMRTTTVTLFSQSYIIFILFSYTNRNVNLNWFRNLGTV